MEQSRIDMFLATNGKKFNPMHIQAIQSRLADMDESKAQIAISLDYKDPTTMLIISILVGSLGIDRFMLGETGLGIIKLLTGGACGIWTIIDWFSIQNRTRDYNYDLFQRMI